MENFVQYSVGDNEFELLCLDSQKEGADAGYFCGDRFAWLETQLNRFKDKQICLFMHHPPVDLGLPMQDKDKMENGEAFLEFIKNNTNVVHLFIGHVHRPISGQVNGISFTTMRSVLIQAPPPIPHWDWSSFVPAKEAPALGIITLSKRSVIVQFEQFCGYEVGTGG